MNLRILIADHYGLMRAGLRALLCTLPDIEIVGEAADDQQAVALAQQMQPDVVLIEISLAKAGGVETTRKIKEVSSASHVLLLSAQDDHNRVWRGFQAGATGYIPKWAPEAELRKAILTVSQGEFYIHPSAIQPPGLLSEAVPDYAFPASQENTLTIRELEVLRLIALGYTNREISVALDIGVRTAESHRARIMDKLDLHTRMELVRYATLHKLI